MLNTGIYTTYAATVSADCNCSFGGDHTKHVVLIVAATHQ